MVNTERKWRKALDDGYDYVGDGGIVLMRRGVRGGWEAWREPFSTAGHRGEWIEAATLAEIKEAVAAWPCEEEPR